MVCRLLNQDLEVVVVFVVDVKVVVVVVVDTVVEVAGVVVVVRTHMLVNG